LTFNKTITQEKAIMSQAKAYVARQQIVNVNGKTTGYELLFRDTPVGINEFTTNLKATSQVLINSLTYMNFNDIVGSGKTAYINCDESILEANFVDMLDPSKFVLEILETTKVTQSLIEKIEKLSKRGYKFALDDFDCSAHMIKQFSNVFKYLDTVKVDVKLASRSSIQNLVPKLKQLGIKILAEKIESREEFHDYAGMGFNLFQGYHFHRPEVLELKPYADVTRIVILELVTLIQGDAETAHIEQILRRQPDLSYKLVKFLNNHLELKETVSSLTQVITLLGRSVLLKWLLVYIYSEVEGGELSQELLNIALDRAEKMILRVGADDRDKAFMTGLFSILDVLFQDTFSNIFKGIKLDQDVANAIIARKGKLGAVLNTIEADEKELFKTILLDNFAKVSASDLIYLLEKNKIHVNK